MGLAIAAYSRLDYIGHHPGKTEDRECEYDPKTFERRHIDAFAYECFPHALEGIPGSPEIRRIESRPDSFLEVGCFAITPGTEAHTFGAGSYSGYNRWREHLGICFGWNRETTDPFMELIHFADNEGTLLWKAARELAGDFEAGREKWRDYVLGLPNVDPHRGSWWIEVYEDWAHACRLAGDGGLIDFH